MKLKTLFENIKRDIRFNHRDELLYFVVENEQKRFCVFETIKEKFFKQTHNVTSLDEFMRIYNRLYYFI